MDWANQQISRVKYAITKKEFPTSHATKHFLFSMPPLIHRSLVGLEDAQMAQESLALEAMIFDNDQGFFGGLLLQLGFTCPSCVRPT